MREIRTIVVTGGPCGGKSTAMGWIQQAFSRLGYTVLFVPETATELISGGLAPWTCGTNLDYQRCQIHLQLEKENREPSMFALLMRRLKKAIRNKLDPDAAAANARFGLPGAAPGEEPEFYDAGDPDEEPTAGESVQPDEKAEACEAADPLAQTLVDRLGLNDEADGQDAEAEEFEEPDETGRELPDQAFDRLFTEEAEEAAPAADEKTEESETAE